MRFFYAKEELVVVVVEKICAMVGLILVLFSALNEIKTLLLKYSFREDLHSKKVCLSESAC